MDDLYQDLLDEGINNVTIISIGKSQYNSSNGNWTNGNSIPVLVDPSPYNTWSSWGANQRDLFFLDADGNYATDFNITTWNYDNIYDQISLIIGNTLDTKSIPKHSALLSAYPNPFNPSTNITFSIPQNSYSAISIYNISGRLIEILSQSYFQSGDYTLTWHAAEYASGIYFIKLDTEFNTLNQKLILIK